MRQLVSIDRYGENENQMSAGAETAQMLVELSITQLPNASEDAQHLPD